MTRSPQLPAWDAADERAARAIVGAFATTGGPIAVGLSGAQGSGKSTMAPRIAEQLRQAGLRPATLSLDDFYLTRSERAELAHTVHPLLATRGVPGTHDVALLATAVDALLRREDATVPRFDKLADDRAVEPAIINGPVDVVLLEGWCIGACPQTDAQLAGPVNELEATQDADGRWRRWVNARLAGHYADLFDRLALRILLRAPDFAVVEQWRAEQEATLTANTGRRGMTGASLHRFIAHYERITRWMLEDEPADLIIRLDASRTPLP